MVGTTESGTHSYRERLYIEDPIVSISPCNKTLFSNVQLGFASRTYGTFIKN